MKPTQLKLMLKAIRKGNYPLAEAALKKVLDAKASVTLNERKETIAARIFTS